MPDHQELLGTTAACTHCIQADLYGNRDDLRASTSHARRIQEALLSLRLLKPGRVGIHFWWTRGVDGSPGWLRHPVLRPFFTTPPTYQLSQEDDQRLFKLLEELRARRSRNTYELAVRRFETTYEKLDQEDRLIDYWIALEALFGDGRSEIRYRISLRIANLLAVGAERVEVFELAKKSYDARSKIVHGARPKGALDELVRETEELLRTALRCALRPKWPSTYEEMDAAVLGIQHVEQ